MVAIGGFGAAYPTATPQDELWEGFFTQHFGGVSRALAKRLFANSGVTARGAVVNPLVEDASGWSTAARMQRYLTEALPLGKAAVSGALADAGVDAADIGQFVVCSCTGYATPGVDILLARDLGLPAGAQRVFVGHMGCYASLPGLGIAANFVTVTGRPAVLLCVEVTSLHIQPPSAEPEQIVCHSLFADAAAAVVLTPSNSGYQVRDVDSITDTTAADHMTWDVTDRGFRMGLSSRVPEVLAAHIGGFVDELLGRQGLTRADVDGWAVHPGGPRILDVIARELALPAGALAESRRILAERGNCSSPTVLMVLDAMRERPIPPRTVVMLAFGPGLTIYAALLTAPRQGERRGH